MEKGGYIPGMTLREHVERVMTELRTNLQGIAVREIARGTGLDPTNISKFLRGKALGIKSLDKLSVYVETSGVVKKTTEIKPIVLKTTPLRGQPFLFTPPSKDK